MATNLETTQLQLPSFYNKYDPDSVLYTVLTACTDIDDKKVSLIKRVDNMIGIDTTNDEDLEYRWGRLLSIKKGYGESYISYRNRLKMAYPSLIGGTAEAIKYSIASVIGVLNNQILIDDYINIYDAWEYGESDYIGQSSRTYGNIVCTVDLVEHRAFNTENNEIMNAINTVKASGICPHLLFLYNNGNELVSMLYDCDINVDNIIDKFKDTGLLSSYKHSYEPLLNIDSKTLNGGFILNVPLIVDNVDDLVDTIKHNISDVASITRTKSTTWGSMIGNTNNTMVTDVFIDTDGQCDNIRYLDIDNSNVEHVEYVIDSVGRNDADTGYITDNNDPLVPLLNNIGISLNNGFLLNSKSNFNDVSNKFIDAIKHTIQESKAFCSNITTSWSTFGTNSLILNSNFVTNILHEADECIDVINYI